MICSCGGRLYITHTYPAGELAKSQRGVCMTCRKRYTLVTVASEADRRGTGARAVAERMRSEGPARREGES
jgi:hypothetical protein